MSFCAISLTAPPCCRVVSVPFAVSDFQSLRFKSPTKRRGEQNPRSITDKSNVTKELIPGVLEGGGGGGGGFGLAVVGALSLQTMGCFKVLM